MADRVTARGFENRFQEQEQKKEPVSTFRSTLDVFNDRVNKNGVYRAELTRQEKGPKQK